jgi:hypothetical protein
MKIDQVKLSVINITIKPQFILWAGPGLGGSRTGCAKPLALPSVGAPQLGQQQNPSAKPE